MQNDVLEKTTMKIAIWSEGRWALGRIHASIQRYVQGHEIHFFDWLHLEDTRLFFQTWDSYDLILGNTAITFCPQDIGFPVPDKYLAKCLAFLHCPVINEPSGFHTEKVVSSLPTYVAVSKDAQQSLEALGLVSTYVPFGVDHNLFYESVKSRSLKRAGFVGRGSVVKQVHLFYDICAKSGLEPVIIEGRESTDLYSDIDLLINCSSFECGPLGNFEAAAMGRPVLSKRVGNWASVRGALFYETVDEAVHLLTTLTQDDWHAYAKTLQTEVLCTWTNEILISRFLQPLLDSMGSVFDFIEIGSADYDTLCNPTQTGLLVEPLDFLTKNLSNQVDCVAVYEGPEPFVPLYYTTDYHDWRRGCNSILTPHPLVPHTHMKYVRTISWSALVQKHSVRYIDVLKLGTGAYDTILLDAVWTTIVKGLRIRKIVCTMPNDDSLLDRFGSLYTLQKTSTHVTLERQFSINK